MRAGLCAVMTLWLSASAQAADPSVAVVNLAGSDAVSRTQEVRAYLSGRGAARSYESPLGELLEGRTKPFTLDLEAVRGAYAAFDYAGAQQRLTTMMDEALKRAPDGALLATVCELLMWRGVVAVAQDDAKAARHWFVGLANLDPGYSLDKARFNPRVQRAFARAREWSRRKGGRPGTIAITTDPPTATGTVDGHQVEPGAISASRGLHLVVLSKRGFQRSATLIEVRSRRTSEQRVELLPEGKPAMAARTLTEASARRSLGERAASMGQLCALIGVRRALAIENLDDRALVARLYEVERKRVRASEPVALGAQSSLDSVGRLVGIVQFGPTALPGGGQGANLVQGSPAPTAKPWYRKWWIWTTVAVVGVAATSVAVVLATQDREAEIVCCP